MQPLYDHFRIEISERNPLAHRDDVRYHAEWVVCLCLFPELVAELFQSGQAPPCLQPHDPTSLVPDTSEGYGKSIAIETAVVPTHPSSPVVPADQCELRSPRITGLDGFRPVVELKERNNNLEKSLAKKRRKLAAAEEDHSKSVKKGEKIQMRLKQSFIRQGFLHAPKQPMDPEDAKLQGQLKREED